MSKHFVQLGPSEMVPERPFTDPVDSMQDVVTLQYMLERLRQTLNHPHAIPTRPRPFVFQASEIDNRYHRIAVAKLKNLLTCDNLHLVGFCGQKRLAADRALVDSIDETLITEFPQHPYLLSYSTLQRADGNACNMVLFSQPQGLARWAQGETHAQAVAVSPDYYHRIRLHHALVPGGLMANTDLIPLRTKYFDFDSETPWWAVRELRRS